ncbi:undecaprenyl-diphosphate phosphatase [Sandarakinorhabdus oryzae]|uniref:undecaprenyl-diphosphate phosphatase n=1 Tax=Sandarakinorhabdus oryzae TaxID=2675220 RepID=UPI0012E17814|nr:undecaprenyl-diphosphate phosphatase [Sandarakinorhabdus oryzae]
MTQPDLLTIILLGIVEGLTEYLPVSSTGHLILASELLGFKGEAGATFEIAIQSGAILAVLVAYWGRFMGVARGLLAREAGAFAFLRNVLLGFLPAAIMGVLFIKTVEALLESPTTVAVSLIVGGIAILWIERRMTVPRVFSVEALPTRTSLLIGLGQCLAMIPGVSRSGATIMAALLLGVDRKTAAEFSFFLAVPTISGATALVLWKNRDTLDASNLSAIGIGFAVSFVVALLVVKGFVALVSRFGFAPFAWYRIAAGSAALVWLAMR